MRGTDLEISRLSVAERIRLAEDRRDSVAAETGDLPLTAAQGADIDGPRRNRLEAAAMLRERGVVLPAAVGLPIEDPRHRSSTCCPERGGRGRPHGPISRRQRWAARRPFGEPAAR